MQRSQTDNGGVEYPPISPTTGQTAAEIARRANGDVTGVAFVLSASDLRRLGLNLDETNAVRPRVMSGVVLVEPVQ